MNMPLDVNVFEEVVNALKKETRQKHVIVTEEHMEAIFSALASKGGLWMHVKNALPEEGENVLVYIERSAWDDDGEYIRKKEIAIGWHIGGNWHVDGCSRVEGLCWMPLPEPPKEAQG